MENESLVNPEDVRSNLDNFHRSAERLKNLIDKNSRSKKRCIAFAMCLCFPCILCTKTTQSK